MSPAASAAVKTMAGPPRTCPCLPFPHRGGGQGQRRGGRAGRRTYRQTDGRSKGIQSLDGNRYRITQARRGGAAQPTDGPNATNKLLFNLTGAVLLGTTHQYGERTGEKGGATGVRKENLVKDSRAAKRYGSQCHYFRSAKYYLLNSE